MRHYYRCQDCLSVGVTTEYYDPAKLVCGLCNGKTEYMGKVSQDHLVKTEERCPCDDRCTCAQGPKCDCKCGGKNHGSHLVVHVIVDAGKIPVIKLNDPEAENRAFEYRMKVKIIRTLSDAIFNPLEEKRKKGYLSTADWNIYRQRHGVYKVLGDVHKARTHKSRIKKADSLIEILTKLATK